LPSDTSTPSDPQRASEPGRLTLYLDECIPLAYAEKFERFLFDQPERPKCIHALHFFKSGVGDREWATKAKQENWLPITADRSKSNRGEKLSRVAKELNLVHIVLTTKVAQLRSHEMEIAIVSCWPDIVAAWKSKSGSEYRLKMTQRRRFVLSKR
jgi:hypothetical protein